MEKVIFWHEAVLISFLFLLIPLLICSSGVILFIRFKINSAERGLRHFLKMVWLFVLHFVLSFGLTVFLLWLYSILFAFFDCTPWITDWWVALSIYFVISECITVPTFYNIYKYFVNSNNKTEDKEYRTYNR